VYCGTVTLARAALISLSAPARRCLSILSSRLVQCRETGYTAYVCGALAVLFIVVPALEIYVIIKVGSILGAMATLGVIIVTGVVGAGLARSQGFSAMRQVQRSLLEGRQVGHSMVEAALVLVAAVLMLTPGFITDIVGFGLLIPPIRRAAARAVVARYTARQRSRVVFIHPMDRGAREGDDGASHVHVTRDGDDIDHDPPPPGVIDV